MFLKEFLRLLALFSFWKSASANGVIYLMSCPFETDLCGWTVTGNDFQWNISTTYQIVEQAPPGSKSGYFLAQSESTKDDGYLFSPEFLTKTPDIKINFAFWVQPQTRLILGYQLAGEKKLVWMQNDSHPLGQWDTVKLEVAVLEEKAEESLQFFFHIILPPHSSVGLGQFSAHTYDLHLTQDVTPDVTTPNGQHYTDIEDSPSSSNYIKSTNNNDAETETTSVSYPTWTTNIQQSTGNTISAESSNAVRDQSGDKSSRSSTVLTVVLSTFFTVLFLLMVVTLLNVLRKKRNPYQNIIPSSSTPPPKVQKSRDTCGFNYCEKH